MRTAAWTVGGAVAGYVLAVVVVVAATLWGHVLRFDGFGSTHGLVLTVVCVAGGGFLGFVSAAGNRRPA